MSATPPTGRSYGRRPRATHTRRLLSVLLAMVIMAAGCGSEEEGNPDAEASAPPEGGEAGQLPEEPVTIRMGSFVPAHQALYVMEHMPEVTPNQGTWYEIEWTQLPPADLARGIASGALDGGPLSSLAFGIAVEQGADLVIIGEHGQLREGNNVPTWLVAADSGITSPADLVGQTIGTIAEGNLTDVIGDAYITSEGGLEPGVDYDKAVIPFPQMQDALLSGQIAAGPFSSPFTQQAMATGEVEVLFTATDVQPVFVASVHVLRRDFIESNREVVEKFMEDWVAAWQWMLDPANRDAVIEIDSEVTGVPVEVLDRYVLTEQDTYRNPNGAVDQEALEATWDFFAEQGAISPELDLEDHIIEELLPPQP